MGADVHAGHAYRAVERREAVDGVPDAALLADPLEQPARHPAAENIGDDEHGVFAPVGVWNRVGREHDVGLRRVFLDRAVRAADRGRDGRHGRRRQRLRVRSVAIEPPLSPGLREQGVVGQIAGGGDDAVAGKIGAVMQLSEILGRDRADGFFRAQDLKAVRVGRPQRLIGEIEDLVIRRVFDRADLFEHDLSLEREIAVPQQRPAHHVGEDVERACEIGIQHARVVRGRIARGVGVERAAAGLERERDFLRRAALRALEDHVLEQVGDAHLRPRLVGAGGLHPNADRRGPNARHPLAQHGDTVGRGGAMDFPVQADRV